MRPLPLFVTLVLVLLQGCRNQAPATALDTCKALVTVAKLENFVCSQSPKTALTNFGPHLIDGACFGPSPDDCKGFVLLFESPAEHEKLEKIEADSAVRVAQSVKAAVSVRVIDANFDLQALARMQQRLDTWAR